MTDKILYLQHLKLEQDEAPTNTLRGSRSDVFLSFVGWEERAIEVVTSRLEADQGVIYRFGGTQSLSKKLHNTSILEKWLKENNSSVSTIVGSSSTDTQTNFETIKTYLVAKFREFGRPYSLTVDISCCPKSYISFLIAYGFSEKILGRLTFYYAHTDYESKSKASRASTDTIFKFTEGDWRTVQIPYLEGDYKPSYLRKLIVLMGAESNATENFLKRYQPDRTSLIVPRPGVTDVIDAAVEASAKSLKKRLEIPRAQVIEVAPQDAAGAAEACSRLAENRSNVDISFVCLGTKPHCIGAALICLTKPNLTMICRSPRRYQHSPGNPNGFSSIYDIQDLSNPLFRPA